MSSPDPSPRTLAYRLAYDGSRFCGMQIQPDQPTVQGALEGALSHAFGGAVRIRFAGRTDTGVHATGQVVAFEAPTPIPVPALRRLVNRRLGGAARLGTGWLAEPGFHPRHAAAMRRYRYLIDPSPFPPDPFRAGKVTYLDRPVDWGVVAAACPRLLGTHDFRAFCVQPAKEPQPIRSIDSLRVSDEGRYKVLLIEGRSFLRGMVRHLVGALLRVGRGERPAAELDRLLELGAEGRKDDSLVPAPPDGLYLDEVRYPDGLPGTEIYPDGDAGAEAPPWYLGGAG